MCDSSTQVRLSGMQKEDCNKWYIINSLSKRYVCVCVLFASDKELSANIYKPRLGISRTPGLHVQMLLCAILL